MIEKTKREESGKTRFCQEFWGQTSTEYFSLRYCIHTYSGSVGKSRWGFSSKILQIPRDSCLLTQNTKYIYFSYLSFIQEICTWALHLHQPFVSSPLTFSGPLYSQVYLLFIFVTCICIYMLHIKVLYITHIIHTYNLVSPFSTVHIIYIQGWCLGIQQPRWELISGGNCFSLSQKALARTGIIRNFLCSQLMS